MGSLHSEDSGSGLPPLRAFGVRGTCRREGNVSACRRVGVGAWGRGGVGAWARGRVGAWGRSAFGVRCSTAFSGGVRRSAFGASHGACSAFDGVCEASPLCSSVPGEFVQNRGQSDGQSA
jgi:hypothetical protein